MAVFTKRERVFQLISDLATVALSKSLNTLTKSLIKNTLIFYESILFKFQSHSC